MLPNQNILWGVIVETEAYSQSEPACHGYNRRTKSNETLFGNPGRLHVYLCYGMHYCINVVTHKSNWANGVLLRAIALPNENERIASGPSLLAKRFGLNLSHDRLSITGENEVWLASRPYSAEIGPLVQTTRIGISKAQELRWRWYLKNSRSISKRNKGDRCPPISAGWTPATCDCQ